MGQGGRPGRVRRPVALAAAAAILVAAAVVVILAASGGDGDGDRLDPMPARLTTPAALERLARSERRPVYWAGPRNGERLELTVTRGDNVYVRYLPAGAPPGDKRPRYLSIGTYPRASAYRDVRRTAGEQPLFTSPVGRGLAVVGRDHPTSVYLAYPGLPVLIEVYAPRRADAQRVVTEGAVRPVG